MTDPVVCVIVVGGSFNPPHREHTRAVELAAHVLQSRHFPVHSSHLAVAPHGWVQNKLRDCDDRWVLSETQRIALCDAAARDCPLISLQTLGSAFGSAESMFKTLMKRGLIPASAVFVDVIGADRAVDSQGNAKWIRTGRAVRRITVCIARAGQEDVVLRALGLTKQEIAEFHVKPRVIKQGDFFFVPANTRIASERVDDDDNDDDNDDDDTVRIDDDAGVKPGGGELSSTRVRNAIQRGATAAELQEMLLPSVFELMLSQGMMGLNPQSTTETES
jgi:nicotinic acid mononucleotide adenylyltransferase